MLHADNGDLILLSPVFLQERLTGGARRVWYEEDMQQAWSPKRGKVSVCDIAIDYGWAWVCIEVVSGRLTQKTLTGGTAADFDQDVAKLVEKKVKQLDATIQHLDRSTLQFRTDDLLAPHLPLRLTGSQPILSGHQIEFEHLGWG
jgi:hypothetical protein